ncbi:MAG: nucleotidyl transferase AbiEii/AbiGii toxin family protein [Chitinophagaceae bacterium]
MNLHNDMKFFSETLRAASKHLDIKLEFVEKDYWITLVLSHLAKSKYVADAVFKGGTSLSKGYNLLERFSEDVDIAIINNNNKSGNEIKTIIRTIEKEITRDFTEIQIDGVTSKGSRFRKSVFEYVSTDKGNTNTKLIVEVNSFANPFPFQLLTIKSFVFDFLTQTGNEKYIEQFNLQPFNVNVLSKEQTLLEKIVSLIRVSFDENYTESISGKIRHFYDLYFLANDPACKEFIESGSFKNKFEAILQHDREIFDEPAGWQNKQVSESPLTVDFDIIWEKIRVRYQTELSALAYRTIPDEETVFRVFKALTKRIQ